MRNSLFNGFGKALLWIICLAMLAVTAVQVFFYTQYRPVGNGKEKVEFLVNEGESWDQVLNHLQDDDLIRSAQAASLYLKLNRSAEHYAGSYELNNGMSTQQIITYLGNPENQLSKDIEFTIIPGSWAKEVAANLAKYYPFSAEEILAKWNDMNYINELAQSYGFLDPAVLGNEQLKVKLEGYLFPETYHLDPNADLDKITRTFLDSFNKFYIENQEAFNASGRSVNDIVTLASMVQFEASDDADMPRVAGVFNNRLNDGMNLESSVTVCYALYENFTDAMACETNPEIDSPYNTYLNPGLPVGPIDNPGAAALMAVLNPESNNYYYFVADINNVLDGKVHYSETYEDHMAIAQQLGLIY